MPHIKVQKLPQFQFPQQYESYTFWGRGRSIFSQIEILDVSYKNEHFLLDIKKVNNAVLIKPEKVTRPASNAITKGALAALVKVGNLEVIASNVAVKKKDHAIKAYSYLKPIDFFIKSFPIDRELWIEVGFGSGRHLLYQAKQHPEIQFIGIEIHKPSIEQILKQIALQKISNIYVIDYDARLFLEFVPSNIVGRIFVHFPVPWDKKPHRRVISSEFIQEAKRVLKRDGTLELRTDSDNYFQYAYDLFLQEKNVKLEVQKNIENVVRSKYEDRWRRLGKNIYDIIYYSLEDSPPLQRECDFTFPSNFSPAILYELTRIPHVEKDFFVHFEDVFQFDSETFLIKVSFGNFNRPEHKYIWYTKDSILYYNTPPVCSITNQKAHTYIKEILNGKECHSSKRFTP